MLNALGMQEFQVYALLFLLGASTVKSLIDTKNWGNRRYLPELWYVFPPIFLIHDMVVRPDTPILLGVKWGLVVLLVVFYYFKEIRPVPTEDYFSLIALLSVLNPILASISLAIYLACLFLLRKKLRYRFPHHTKEIPTMQFIVMAGGISLLLLLF